MAVRFSKNVLGYNFIRRQNRLSDGMTFMPNSENEEKVVATTGKRKY